MLSLQPCFVSAASDGTTDGASDTCNKFDASTMSGEESDGFSDIDDIEVCNMMLQLYFLYVSLYEQSTVGKLVGSIRPQLKVSFLMEVGYVYFLKEGIMCYFV